MNKTDDILATNRTISTRYTFSVPTTTTISTPKYIFDGNWDTLDTGLLILIVLLCLFMIPCMINLCCMCRHKLRNRYSNRNG